jgi:ribosomal protein L28
MGKTRQAVQANMQKVRGAIKGGRKMSYELTVKDLTYLASALKLDNCKRKRGKKIAYRNGLYVDVPSEQDERLIIAGYLTIGKWERKNDTEIHKAYVHVTLKGLRTLEAVYGEIDTLTNEVRFDI